MSDICTTWNSIWPITVRSLRPISRPSTGSSNTRRPDRARLSRKSGAGRRWRNCVPKPAVGSDVFAEQVKQRGPIPPSRNPFRWTRIEQINFAVTWGLTAIGLCLLVGLFTRPAALGGALFMAFVVMTQPAWPTIFPHDPPVVGHALLVNKDFIEMVALLVVASTAVGRWAGLDYFFGRFVHDPICARWCPLRRWCPCCGGAKSEAAQTPASTPSAAKPAQ